MSHVRTQIRDAAATALAGVGTVIKSRVYPVSEDALPVLLVYADNETITLTDLRSLERNLSLVVECVVQAADLDTALDPLLVGVETALTANTLGGIVLRLLPAQLDVTLSGEGAAPIARARLTFEALYRTSITDPETST